MILSSTALALFITHIETFGKGYNKIVSIHRNLELSMIESGKISTRQYIFMLFVLLLSPIVFTLPRLVIAESQQDAWQVMLLTFAVDSGLAVVYYILGLRYPQQTMFEYSQTILGNWLGKFVALLFTVFFSFMTLMVLKILCEFIETVILPDTPRIVIYLVLLGIGLYAVNSGLEVIARLSEILAPLMLFPLLIILTLSLNHVELGNLLPVFQHSVWNILKTSFMPISWYGVCIIMGILMAYQNHPKQSYLGKVIAIGSVTLLTIMTLLSLITIFGVDYSSQQIYPVFRLAQIIEVGDFFERIETLVIIFWVAGAFLSLTLLYYSSVLGLAQVFNIQKYQKLSPFFGIMMLILSKFLFSNLIVRLDFVESIFPIFAIFVEDFLIVILLIVSLVRHGIKKT